MHKIEAEHFTQMTFFSPRKKKQKRVRDDFKAFLVEGARFTSIEQYPIIEPWMIPDVDEIRVVPFNKIDRISNLEDYYICFYCRDKDFRKTMNNPKQYLKLFRRAKGLIGFDFSVYSDMPIVKQKAQMYDNLALSFFYGMRNIPVIPNIRYGNESTRDEFLTAIPKHSVISIGSYPYYNPKRLLFTEQCRMMYSGIFMISTHLFIVLRTSRTKCGRWGKCQLQKGQVIFMEIQPVYRQSILIIHMQLRLTREH